MQPQGHSQKHSYLGEYNSYENQTIVSYSKWPGKLGSVGYVSYRVVYRTCVRLSPQGHFLTLHIYHRICLLARERYTAFIHAAKIVL